jgi:phage gp29-like protein
MIKDINHRFTKAVQNNHKRQPKTAGVIEKLEKRSRARTANDISDWSSALRIAEKRDDPDRTELIQIWKNIEIDGHVSGIITTIKNKIKAKDFWLIDSKGEPDEESKKLFESKWFQKYIDWSIEAPFHGFSLIQLNNITDGQFKDMELVPREFVLPDFGIVKKNLTRYSKGDSHWSYKEGVYKDWFVFIGEDKDLGLFNKIAPQAISKKHIQSALWQFVEIFGMPMRIAKTDLEDPAQKANMIAMMTDMGRAGYAVVGGEDQVEYTESIKGDVAIFEGAISMANQEISKAFTGVSGMFEEKSFVGSAEVQERVFKELILAFQRSIMFDVNDMLIPRMQKHGNFPDSTFSWKADDLLSTLEKAEVITGLSPFYDITPEEVAKSTGIEIEAQAVSPEVKQNAIASQVNNLYSKIKKEI